MKCSECKEDTTPQASIAAGDGSVVCIDCVVDMGTKLRTQQVSGEQLKRAKKLAREELGDLVPREAVRDIVEEGVRKILLKTMDPDVAYGWITNQVVVMFVLAYLRDKLKMLAAFRAANDEGIAELEKEVRGQLEKIHKEISNASH